jgi:hypothetical protein
MNKTVGRVALSLLLLGGIAAPGGCEPCHVNGTTQHGGGPREGSPECKKLQEKAGHSTPV